MENDLLDLNLKFLILKILHVQNNYSNLQYLEPNQKKFIINKIDKRMNKSKSQSSLPLGSSNAGSKPKSDFVYKNQDDMYLFQNKDLFLQVQFKSPIKQICQYLEQYEKYCFLTDISSIGIKANQQRQYYNKITSSINNQFQKYLQKTVLYIQEIIMNVHFMKHERWHYFTQIIKGYKTHALNKNIDCYNFNPEQFSPYHAQVMSYLKNIRDNSDTNQMKKIKMEIISNRKIIQKKVSQIHQTMYVKNPFVAQNQRRVQVRSDELFQSYMKKFAYETLPLQSSFDLRFHSSYDSIKKFPQFMKQFTTKGQIIASNIIKQYNQSCSNLVNTLNRSILKQTTRKQIQMNEYYNEWKKGEKLTPILRNKIQKVNFSNRIICRNENTTQDYTLQISQQPRYSINFKNQQQDQILNNRVPANNPYFDFWSHVYDRNRLRKLQLFFQKPKISRKHHNLSKLDLATRYRKKFTKQKRVIQQNIYWVFITARNAQQQKIWQLKTVITENERKSYQFSEDQAKKSKYYYNQNATNEQNNKVAQLQKRIEAYRQYTQKYDKDKRVEDELIPVKLKRANNGRNYLQFALKFGLKDAKKQLSQDFVTRYGIKVPRNLYQVKNVPKLQEFLFNFLRQKLFREDQKYKDKQSMVLMYNVKPAEQFCNWKTIKRLGQLTQTMKKYYIWASQIIKYQQQTDINKQTTCKFTIYAFSDVINSKTLLFQLKRRLNIRINGEIIQKYNTNQPNSMESIISKFELMHRLIFNQHLETPNGDFSFKKGQQLFSLILKQLSNEPSGQ